VVLLRLLAQQGRVVPVYVIGVGETPEDVQPFDPAAFIDAMFEE
jgi:signal recognition particle GTPase